MKALRVFLCFSISGAIGFLIDTAVLYALKNAMGLYWSRCISFLAAASATWVMNRNWTFRDRESGVPHAEEFKRYVLLMVGGGLINYGIYAVLVGQLELAKQFPVIGIAAGSVVGMIGNLIGSRFILYRFARI